jgi:hypothetical protein
MIRMNGRLLTGGRQRTPRDLGGGVISTTLYGGWILLLLLLPRSLSLSLFLLLHDTSNDIVLWDEPRTHDASAISPSFGNTNFPDFSFV